MKLIYPEWPVPDNVHALMSTRDGGISLPPFDSLNVGDHVDDDSQHVLENRRLLLEQAPVRAAPVWLTQVHGTRVLDLDDDLGDVEADASVSRSAANACAIMTADCLPVLLCNRSGDCVAAAHAGWRGLLNGVLDNTIAEMQCAPEDVLVWLGAAIGPDAFEVGAEVYEQFLSTGPSNAEAFKPGKADGKWLADLYQLARLRLQSVGISAGNIYGGGRCTYSESETFFSYRRENRTGRMVSLIWLSA